MKKLNPHANLIQFDYMNCRTRIDLVASLATTSPKSGAAVTCKSLSFGLNPDRSILHKDFCSVK